MSDKTYWAVMRFAIKTKSNGLARVLVKGQGQRVQHWDGVLRGWYWRNPYNAELLFRALPPHRQVGFLEDPAVWGGDT